MAQIRRRSKAVLEQNRRRMVDYLREHPCVDCGEDDIVVLEFDHLRDKSANVSAIMLQKNEWRRVLEEMAKCEVVCANCHRRRTARRANSYRHRARQES
jgi:L-lysine 2,3-aminomutase